MGSAEWLRMYAQQLEDQHGPQNLTIGMREAADEIEKLRAALEGAAVQFANNNLPAFSHQCRAALEGK